MRFQLHLAPLGVSSENSLPIDYQYMQSAVIYKILASCDKAYASWLHDNGFKLDNGKRFKLFCYSRFRFNALYYIDTPKQVINVGSGGTQWIISFLPERSTQEFVQGYYHALVTALPTCGRAERTRKRSNQSLTAPSLNTII